VQLPVDQFGESTKDWALFADAISHGLTEEAFEILLKLRSSTKLHNFTQTFMETGVNVEKRQVDCCLHGCVALPQNRSHMTWCGASGMATRRQARQMTNSPLTAWLLNMLSDPSFCPQMMFVMKEARCAAY